jgi:serine/threonine-protein kinase
MTADPAAIGRYQVQSLLGRGGMGAVYLAHDPLLKRQVVIKVVHEKGASYDHAMERFQREAEISAKLNHPNIITIHDVGSDAAMGPFIAMEYVKGQSLAAMIRGGGPPPVEQVLRIIAQASRALHAAAQEGIVHRDVKPENILVSQEGRVKLTDFGIAKLGDSILTTVGGVVGTPSYMAPELLRDAIATPVTDCYALAVTAFESLTGDLPFKGDSVASMLLHIVQDPPTIPASLSPALAGVFCRAFEKAPGRRYPDVNSFTGALIHAVPLGSSVRTKLLLMLAGEDVSLHGFVPVSTNQWALPPDSGGVPPARTPTPTPVVALPSEPDSSAPTALARPAAPPVRPAPTPQAPVPRPSISVFPETPAPAPRRSSLPLALLVTGVVGFTVLGLVGAGTWIARRRAAASAAQPAPAAEPAPATEPAQPGPGAAPPTPAPAAPGQDTSQLQEELRRLQAANARDEARLRQAGKPASVPAASPASAAPAPAPSTAAAAPPAVQAPAPAAPEPLPNQAVQVLHQASAPFPPQSLGNPLYTLREPRVKLRVFVGETGLPLQVVVASGVGRGGFDEAAIAAARRSRFSPAVQGGKAVGAWTELTYTFRPGR